jgi:nucleoside-diphosphate-sugar epimerase
MNQVSHVLVAGCGYVGTRLAELLLADGVAVTGIRRTWPTERPTGLTVWTADLAGSAPWPAGPFSHIVYAAAAGQFADDAYKRAYVDGLAATLAFARRQTELKRVLFTSSTGVYGAGGGDWVDEETPVATAGPFSVLRMVEAENLLRESGLEAVAVRFGGIYGPGRQSLLDAVAAGTARLAGGEPQWTNRIHRDDCAGVLRFLLGVREPAPVYVAVDDEPAPRDEILRWLAAELGQACPPLGVGDTSPQRGNRRCRNRRLTSAGYRFVYPTYREGFRALLSAR